jgi:hypothetical protein
MPIAAPLILRHKGKPIIVRESHRIPDIPWQEDPVQAFANVLIPDLQEGIQYAWFNAKRRFPHKKVRAMLKRGEWHEIIELSVSHLEKQFDSLDGFLLQAVQGAGAIAHHITTNGPPRPKISLESTLPLTFASTPKIELPRPKLRGKHLSWKKTFGLTKVEANRLVSEHVSLLKGVIDRDARAAVRRALVDGVSKNRTPAQISRSIRDSLPLNERQQQALNNYRSYLDRLIERGPTKASLAALRKGGLSPSKARREQDILTRHGLDRFRAADMLAAYELRLRKQRSEVVAESVLASLVNEGQEAKWLELIAKGELPEQSFRQWITRRDEQVCKLCAPMHRKVTKVGEPWQTSKGPIMTPNHIHQRCRCGERLVQPVEEVG